MLVHKYPRLPTIVITYATKVPFTFVAQRPQMCTIVDDYAQIAESGLKPPFESPHLDFPDLSGPLWLSVQSQSRTRLRIAASIAFLLCVDAR